jgi:type I site-specific restriction endonuclease
VRAQYAQVKGRASSLPHSGRALGKTPEEKAREAIDILLESAGWNLRDRDELNLGAGLGVAVCEFPLKVGFARAIADYLFVPSN